MFVFLRKNKYICKLNDITGMKKIFSFCIGCVMSTIMLAQNDVLKVNQVGFEPEAEKTASIEVASVDAKPQTVTIINPATGKAVWKGKTSRTAKSPFSDKVRQIVDFSSFTTEGRYQLVVGENKAEICVSKHSLTPLSVAAIKAFYYQRASMPIEAQYAGKWARPAAHMDTNVQVHPSAATAERPAGTVISSSWGWYDAGDYNKYIVNSGYTVAVMMNVYEQNKDYYKSLNVNIPESKNNAPDLLDEIYYNLKWMLTMQDTDGGLYHKLTTPNFESFIAPSECKQQRYVVKKTTAATLDFAACMAMASRIYKEYESEFPGFSAQALEQAEKAFAWAKAHPNEEYDQNKMNASFDPDVVTGAYDDKVFDDEFYWAATELYFATGKNDYRDEALSKKPSAYSPASWGNVAELGMLSWMNLTDENSISDKSIADGYKEWLIEYVKPYAEAAETSCFLSPAGNSPKDFFWGCNAEGCCWRGVQMLYVFKLTGDANYKLNAQRCMNYLLGQNATGYCYVTGFGTKPSCHPHHRLSESNPNGTLPGFLVGGPNPGQQDKDYVEYPTRIPDESYIDNSGSYASNEIAINWNATLVALAGWLDALQ